LVNLTGTHPIITSFVGQRESINLQGICSQSEEQEQPILVERHLCCVSTRTATIYFPTGERRHLNMGTIFQICSWSNVEMGIISTCTFVCTIGDTFFNFCTCLCIISNCKLWFFRYIIYYSVCCNL
jgi:hypothetical protein